MKALTITYQRVFNLGNYESERIEITLQIEEGETAQQVLDAARKFVARQVAPPKSGATPLPDVAADVPADEDIPI
jgi:hypothetical protein